MGLVDESLDAVIAEVVQPPNCNTKGGGAGLSTPDALHRIVILGRRGREARTAVDCRLPDYNKRSEDDA